MSGNTPFTEFAATFSQLELPWVHDSYYRANFYPGAAASQIGLPNHSYSTKSNVLGSVPPAHIVYGPTEQSFLQPLVFAPVNVADPCSCCSGAWGYPGWLGGVCWRREWGAGIHPYRTGHAALGGVSGAVIGRQVALEVFKVGLGIASLLVEQDATDKCSV